MHSHVSPTKALERFGEQIPFCEPYVDSSIYSQTHTSYMCMKTKQILVSRILQSLLPRVSRLVTKESQRFCGTRGETEYRWLGCIGQGISNITPCQSVQSRCWRIDLSKSLRRNSTVRFEFAKSIEINIVSQEIKIRLYSHEPYSFSVYTQITRISTTM